MPLRDFALLRASVTFRPLWSVVVALLSMSLLASTAGAQATTQAPKIPAPIDIDLKSRTGQLLSKDGVDLKATFYPGTKGKDTVPIIMVHMWEGKRSDYSSLASYLQKQGHAVLVPDLRGHGESTAIANSQEKLNLAQFRPIHFERMVADDMEACKKYLMEKNNSGELNIDKLCVVGAEMGAVIAVNWAMLDWSWPDLATGKQGKDVKALVLLSPIRKVEKGTLMLAQPSRHPAIRRELAVYIIYGDGMGSAAFKRDAEQFYEALLPFHKDKSAEDQDLFLFPVKTALQGTKMLTPQLKLDPSLEARIGAFIEGRVAAQRSVWRDRSGVAP